MTLTIGNLQSGGVITNYYCTSRCRHCAYFCGPGWKKEYIDDDTLRMNLEKVRSLGCFSLHIGGGEPLLNPPALIRTLDGFSWAGITVEYVETNGSWYRTQGEALSLLKELKKHGLHTLLVSISPFHNEFIPWEKTEGVLAACEDTGMGIFPWVEGFIPDLRSFPADRTNTLEEFESRFGEGYLRGIPRRYWISLRGRALKTYREYMRPKSLEKVLREGDHPCGALFDTTHFHVDLFGNYIPGLCTGLSIPVNKIGGPLNKKEMPFVTMLMEKGVTSLFHRIRREYGFIPADEYVSTCELCYEMRKYLVVNLGLDQADLQPREYYLHD